LQPGQETEEVAAAAPGQPDAFAFVNREGCASAPRGSAPRVQ
jgi:hypothetical protein